LRALARDHTGTTRAGLARAQLERDRAQEIGEMPSVRAFSCVRRTAADPGEDAAPPESAPAYAHLYVGEPGRLNP
jgi:hypothetical protein